MIKKFVLIFSFVFTLLFFYQCEKPVRKFEFDQTILQSSMERLETANVDFSEEINQTKLYTEEVIFKYRKYLKQIEPIFQDSFLFSANKEISARYIISAFDESLLYIYPSTKSRFVVDCINAPVQLGFFKKLFDVNNPEFGLHDIDYSSRNLDIIKAKRQYQDIKTQILIGEKNPYIIFGESLIIITNPYKFVHFEDNKGILTFWKSMFKISWIPNEIDSLSEESKIILNGILILNAENNFNRYLSKINEISQDYFDTERWKLIEKSEFFRQSLLHPKLNPLAKEIVEKKQESEKKKDPSLYPTWEQNADLSNLRDKAFLRRSDNMILESDSTLYVIDSGYQYFHIDSIYIDNLIKDITISYFNGNLLWYYSSKKSFMFQWAIINIILFIGLLIIGRNNLIKIAENSGISKLKVFGGILSIIIAVNGWVFIMKPTSLEFKYWLIPGLIFILVLLLLYSYSKIKPEKESV